MDQIDFGDIWSPPPDTPIFYGESSIDIDIDIDIASVWSPDRPEQLQVESAVAPPLATVESTQTDGNGNETVDSEVAPSLAAAESTKTDGNGNGNENVDSEVAPPLAAVVSIQTDSVAVVKPIQTDDNGNEDVDSEVAPPLTDRKRSRGSQAWDNFDLVTEDGIRWVKCKHCPKKYKGYSSKKGTSNLLNHMRKCTQSGGNGDGDKPAHETGRTKAIAVLNREENNVFGPPQNHPPSATQNVDIYNEKKKEMREIFNTFSSGLSSITINFWKPDDTIIFCCLTLHLIDDGWKLKKMVLDFKKVTREPKSVWDAVDALQRMLLEWNIGKKVCCITAAHTDKEVVEIVNQVKHLLYYGRDRKLFQINCFVHILDLLIKEGLQKVRDIYIKMKNHLFCFRDQSPQSRQLFTKAVEDARSKGIKVTSEDLPSDFPFNFDMLGRILGLRGVFLELLAINSDYGNYPITEEQWDDATVIYKCLELLNESARRFSESKCRTTNEYFPEVCNIYFKLQGIWEENSDSKILQSVALKMKVTLKIFWDESIESLAIAVILDPRFKFDIVKGWCKKIHGQDAEQECKRIYDSILRVYKEYAGGNTLDHLYMLDSLGMPCTSSNDDSTSSNDDSFNSQKSELERYLEDSKLPPVKEFDILDWWHVVSLMYPTLAKMARDFLAIPISAAQSNPSFNDEVLKINQALADQDPAFIEAFVNTRYWYMA
ncbi:zinc finger BED domain-containing protein RICESLEEPER 1-like [Pistacia vera]|uniref:zinc finger BED domain-containing protein RICESLEEPER 1-like n=1 Tax=Pistacia vera TaxID=55513 RepID=UPI001263E3FA|nr:zinc finger BED domain-containing protein RICESLEEPER 1-like [Pistacia vera]